MDNSLFSGSLGMQLRRSLAVAGWLLVAIMALGIVYVASSISHIGEGIPATNTIAVTGHGEYLAVPDIATFTYSVDSTKATVADAQAAATAASNAITSYLTSAGIDSKDIQTTGYSIEPQYSYSQAACPQIAPANGGGIYCPPGKQILTGYQVSQTTTVKVRDTSKAGDILAGVGSKGATQVSGLSFTFDDPSAPQAQARQKAITDAQSKAQTLAKELGVSLGRVTAFNENGNNPGPIPYALNATASGGIAASAPQISVGQNNVTDDVSITYEIK